MNQSSKYKFNIFLDTDKVDIDKINDNFRKLDDMYMVQTRTQKASDITGDITGTINWIIEQSRDKIVRFYGRVDVTNSLVNKNVENPNTGTPRSEWMRTNNIVVNFPFTLTYLNNIQLSLQMHELLEYPAVVRNCTTAANEKTQVTIRVHAEKPINAVSSDRRFVYICVDGVRE